MFDSVLKPETLPKRRLGAGAAIALGVWAPLATATWRMPDARPAPAREVAVTFVRSTPQLPAATHPPPPPPPRARAAPRAPRAPIPVASLVAPTELAREAPPERAPEPAPAPLPGPTSEPGDVEGGASAGVPDGLPGGIPGTIPGRLDFDDRMTPPVKLSGPDPQYTDRALDREVEGTMVVRCVVDTVGKVFGCRVLKGLPYMDRAVIDALERRTYRPATLAGRPVEVRYDFKITLRLR